MILFNFICIDIIGIKTIIIIIIFIYLFIYCYFKHQPNRDSEKEEIGGVA
jgi:hypothetical protein